MSRITIDYTPALRQTAGIGRYTRGLIQALAQLDRTHQYTLFSAGEQTTLEGWPENFGLRVSPVPARWLTAAWQRLRLPLPFEWVAGACDLYHSTDFALPPLQEARGVVTVHDLSFLRVPECADPGLRSYLKDAVPRAVRRADRVLADSANTRDDLVELLHVPAERISIIPAGVEPRFRRVTGAGELAAVRARYQLPEHFILSASTLEPRKNIVRLIEAYALLRCEQPDLAQHLVIAGKPGWLYDDIFRAAHSEKLAGWVTLPGFVADEDLPALYSLADLFAFPSLYEGFGLPPLEAMACGTPVVSADNSSLPETLGTAAVFAPAGSTTDLAIAMWRVLANRELKEHLSLLGPQQAAAFTWPAAARKLLAAYQLALA